jgi:hypothetical protein
MSRSRLSAKGPSVAEVCRWAGVDDTTRNGWAKYGLVRHIGEDVAPDLSAAVETVVAARLLERLTPDDALLAWTAISPRVGSLEDPPVADHLDLAWFPSAPGEWLLVTTDTELAQGIRRQSHACIVVEIGPAIGNAIRSYRLVTKGGWSRESSLKAAKARRGSSKRGRKPRFRSDAK